MQSFGRPFVAALVAAGLLAGCKARESAPEPTNTTTPSVQPSPAASPSPQAQPVEIKSEKDGLEFTYKWPGQAASIPELDRWLRGNAESLRAKAGKDAASDKASAAKDGYPFRGHSYEETFTAVADTPRVLVLQSEGYVYTGGAHGMPIATVVIWDKAAKQRLATSALVDLAAFKRLANDRFCKELDNQREQRRGAPVKHDDPNEISSFTSCVDMAKQTLLPVSKGGGALDTLRAVIGPYEAGPYAEGSYTIDLPFDAKLLATVKPAWKDAFAAR